MLTSIFWAAGVLLIWYRLLSISRPAAPAMPERWELDPNSYRDDTGTGA